MARSSTPPARIARGAVRAARWPEGRVERPVSPIVLVIGAPGSGKGTQAALLSARHHFVYIALGEQLRSEIRHHSRLGRQVARYVAAGRLVPNGLVREEVAAALRKERRPIAERGAILDGYPRTLGQAKELLRLLQAARLANPLIVVNLRGADRVFVPRLLGRGRADDTPVVVRRRLRRFRRETGPMLRFLRRQARVIDVPAAPTASVVARAIWTHLRGVLRGAQGSVPRHARARAGRVA